MPKADSHPAGRNIKGIAHIKENWRNMQRHETTKILEDLVPLVPHFVDLTHIQAFSQDMHGDLHATDKSESQKYIIQSSASFLREKDFLKKHFVSD